LDQNEKELRERVLFLEALIDSETNFLLRQPSALNAKNSATRMRKEAGLPSVNVK
jgi:hypothetical protein